MESTPLTIPSASVELNFIGFAELRVSVNKLSRFEISERKSSEKYPTFNSELPEFFKPSSIECRPAAANFPASETKTLILEAELLDSPKVNLSPSFG